MPARKLSIDWKSVPANDPEGPVFTALAIPLGSDVFLWCPGQTSAVVIGNDATPVLVAIDCSDLQSEALSIHSEHSARIPQPMQLEEIVDVLQPLHEVQVVPASQSASCWSALLIPPSGEVFHAEMCRREFDLSVVVRRLHRQISEVASGTGAPGVHLLSGLRGFATASDGKSVFAYGGCLPESEPAEITGFSRRLLRLAPHDGRVTSLPSRGLSMPPGVAFHTMVCWEKQLVVFGGFLEGVAKESASPGQSFVAVDDNSAASPNGVVKISALSSIPQQQ